MMITVERLSVLCRDLFRSAGAAEADAAAITDSLMWATLRGHDTHGVGHLPLYLGMFLEDPMLGELNKSGDFKVVGEGPSTVAIDGNRCVGQRVCLEATRLVMGKARETGVGLATVSAATHNGALGFFVSQIAEQDMIGVALACSGAACAPYGGVDRMLGTNPLAYAVPALEEPMVVADMATSATTWLGVFGVLASGDPFPEGWILDDEGRPTTDRSRFSPGTGPYSDRPPLGSLASLGGAHKGFALQLGVELIGGVLAGLTTGNDVMGERAGDARKRLSLPTTILAIDIARFQNPESFKGRVDERLRELRASRRSPGVDRILIPGERGAGIEQARRREGVPISDRYWEAIAGFAARVGVDVSDYLG